MADIIDMNKINDHIEPLAVFRRGNLTGTEVSVLMLASIAISTKRMADMMEVEQKRQQRKPGN